MRDLGVSCPRTDERHHEEAQVDQVDVDETLLDDESVVSSPTQTRSPRWVLGAVQQPHSVSAVPASLVDCEVCSVGQSVGMWLMHEEVCGWLAARLRPPQPLRKFSKWPMRF